MDPSISTIESHPYSSVLDTSNISFSTQINEDHHSQSESSFSLSEATMALDENETETKFVPHSSMQIMNNNSDLATTSQSHSSQLETDDNSKSVLLPPPAHPVQKRKCIMDLFPWLNEVTKINQKCLGSMSDLKNVAILDAMDFLIGKLMDDYHEYYKSPKLAIILARYIRQFLYVYRHLYQCFELGKEYFKRMAKILAIYTDLELCASVLGQELDTDTANRIQLVYRAHLEFAEEAVVLDVFINMKRLCRGHRGILNLILQYFLVKITVQEPVELSDDIFIKYLIVYKKWLAVEEVLEDKENIRNAFITQVKPKKSLCMNTSYAPYLPADEEGSTTIDNYVRMLDKKYSLEPLIRALEMSEKNSMTYEELPDGIVRQISEVVILSDDEDEPSKTQAPTIKSEPMDHSSSSNQMESWSDLIDLTEEAFDETDIQRHYISWLSDLVTRAKVKPVTVDQRLEVAVISSDIIVIDDVDDDNNKPPSGSDEGIAVHAKVTHVDSPSSDSGCVIMNREEVGIHSNNNFDMSQTSFDADVDALSQPNLRDQTSSEDIIGRSNDADFERFAIKTTLVDGNGSPSINMTAGSISSCSESAAEQLLTVASKKQTVDDLLPLDYAEKAQLTTYSTERGTKTVRFQDADCTNQESIARAATSPASTSPANSLSLQRHKHESKQPSSSISRKHQEAYYSNRNLANRHVMTINKSIDTQLNEYADRNEGVAVAEEEEDASSFLMDVFCSKTVRSQLKNRSGSAKSSSIKIVNPTRYDHSNENTINPNIDWTEDDSDMSNDPQDLTNPSQKKLQFSVPLSTIKTSSLLSRNVGLCDSIRRMERLHEINQDETDDDDFSEHGDMNDGSYSRSRKHGDNERFAKLMRRSGAKSSPTQNHERSVRFADDLVNEQADDDENSMPVPRRRNIGKYDVPNIDETLPSTIMERKTYIKPSNNCPKYNNKTYTQTSTRQSSVMPPISSLALQQNHLSIPQSLSNVHDSPARSILHPQTHQQQQPYRVFYSDEDGPCLTPYDKLTSTPEMHSQFATLNHSQSLKRPASPRHAMSAPHVSPETYQKIDGCYVRCDILDEKVFTAVVQLIDIYKNQSRTVRPIGFSSIDTKRVQRRKSLAERRKHRKLPLSIPNFIVTKVTEKKSTSREPVRFDIRAGIESEPETMQSFDYGKPTRKQQEIAKTQMMVQMQRKKSLRIFNKFNDTDVDDSGTELESLAYSAVDSDTDREADSEPIYVNPTLKQRQYGHFTSNIINSEPDYVQPQKVNKFHFKQVRFSHKSAENNYNNVTGELENRNKPLSRKNIVNKNSDLDHSKPKSYRKSIRKNTVMAATTTDAESEVEYEILSNRRRSLRKLRPTFSHAESEPEFGLSFNKRKSCRSFTDIDSETDGEIFSSTQTPKLPSRIQPISCPKSSGVPKNQKTKNQRGVRNQLKSNSELKSKTSMESKIETIQKTDFRLGQHPVVKLIDLKNRQRPETIQKQIMPHVTGKNGLDNVCTFPPLQELPDFQKLRYNESVRERCKSDTWRNTVIKNQFYTKVANLSRRYSCFAGTKAPQDLFHQATKESDDYTELYNRRPHGNMTNKLTRSSLKKKLSVTLQSSPYRKRGRPKKYKNLTKQLLDSVDFSSLIDIAELNKKEIENETAGDDMTDINVAFQIYGSSSESGDIDRQSMILQHAKHVEPIQVESPLMQSNCTNLDTASKPIAEPVESLEMNEIAQDILKTAPSIEKTDLNVPLPQSMSEGVNCINNCLQRLNHTNTLLESEEIPSNLLSTPVLQIHNNELSVNAKNTSPVLNENTNDGTGRASKDANPNDEHVLADRVDEDDEIESPAYEPHISESHENTIQIVEPQDKAIKTSRVRKKRTRGRARWTRPRRRPPIKLAHATISTVEVFNDIAGLTQNANDPLSIGDSTLNLTQNGFDAHASSSETLIDDDICNESLSPPKILASLQLQKAVKCSQPDKKKGRKRKMDIRPAQIAIEETAAVKCKRVKNEINDDKNEVAIKTITEMESVRASTNNEKDMKELPKSIKTKAPETRRNRTNSEASSEERTLAQIQLAEKRCKIISTIKPIFIRQEVQDSNSFESSNISSTVETIATVSGIIEEHHNQTVNASKESLKNSGKFQSMRLIQKRKAISLKK